jgi:hypothetical protein
LNTVETIVACRFGQGPVVPCFSLFAYADILDVHGGDVSRLIFGETVGPEVHLKTKIHLQGSVALADELIIHEERDLMISGIKPDDKVIPIIVQSDRIDGEPLCNGLSDDKIEVAELLIIDQVHILTFGREQPENIAEIDLHVRDEHQVKGNLAVVPETDIFGRGQVQGCSFFLYRFMAGEP